jgi:homoserine dehydrogenase
MSVDVVDFPTLDRWPLKIRGKKPGAGGAIKTIRIGILGLGHVGQAVARLTADRSATAHARIRFEVEQALVRDVDKPRQCPSLRLTSDPAAFLNGDYDVVVEALDSIEPARTIVAQLLARGVSVVTANKALVAEHREQLESTAASAGAAFRYEATALSAIPFLGTLADRPLVASVDRVLAIVNGTSNFILSSLAEPGASFDAALARAQDLGYAEPDASRDLDGLDAADKLTLLTALFGWGKLSRDALEVSGIRSVTSDDLAAARSLGGTIKAVVSAERDGDGVRAFVGPVFLPSTELLASLSGVLNGIRLDGRHVQNLFFSGPGAGPDVTAATLLDDAIQAASAAVRLKPDPHRDSSDFRTANKMAPVFAASPATAWLLRVTCPGVLPSASATASLVDAAGLPVERVADYAAENTRWIFIGARSRREVDAALAKLAALHRIDAAAFRRL